jgi:F-type H+-transporting ATPase subunit epsilon
MVDHNGNVHCTIITPDRQVLDVQVTSVVLPAHDGQIGVLQNRAALLCKLGIGVVRLGHAGQERRVFVDGGFAQVRENNVTVLTRAAMEPDQVDLKTTEAALKAAYEMRITDEASLTSRSDAIARAKSQLALASSS